MTQASASDRKSIRAQEKLAKQAEIERSEVLRSIMSTPMGRKWLWSFLSDCHMFDANSLSDPRLAALFDGERNVGLRILNDIMAFTPDQFILAMREANVRRDSDNRSTSPRSSEGSASDQYSRGPDSRRDVEGSIDLIGGIDYDPYRQDDA